MNKTPRVLIVEDEAIIARDIQMQLASSGFYITGIAGNAVDAFALIEQDSPDLVLMDIKIQGEMDGVEAAQIVRNRYALPVIYMTAYADETTLGRAQITEPFGYIVKPLGTIHLKAMITMVMYKHRTEQEVANNRKFLSTILQGLPDAVLVADASGAVLFINRAAERLTGWSNGEVIGRDLVAVVPIEDKNHNIISMRLFRQALSRRGPLRIPNNSALLTKSGAIVEIAGHLAVASIGSRREGVFLTLKDATLQRLEEQSLQQEQQMFVVGELARGVALGFYGLFDLIDDCVTDVAQGERVDIDLALRASQIGKSMSANLIDFREAHGAAHAVNISEYLVASKSLLQRFTAGTVQIEVAAVADVGYVLSTGNHLEQLLMHLVRDGEHRIDGSGTISITANRDTQITPSSRSRSYVRLAVCSKRGESPINSDFPFGDESADLGLTIVRAMATSAGGFTRVYEMVEDMSRVEVFLPQHETRAAAVAATGERPYAALVVGLQLRFVKAVERAVGDSTVILEARTIGEASLISELFQGEIDLIIVNGAEVPSSSKDLAFDRIRASRPRAEFLNVIGADAESGVDPLNSADLETQVRGWFNRRVAYAAASGSDRTATRGSGCA